MDKPIIFFSHSSKDEYYLKALKESLMQKTGSAIEIFLSSDGQSIPFGKNWVYSIQENLSKSSIMFVFISPNSITSNWLYFESGFAYSRDINVVPIGILGVDLNQINPPLSLLQGFNLNKAESINNLIAVINKAYSTKFPLDFSNSDYENIFGTQQSLGVSQDIYSVVLDAVITEKVPILKNIKFLFDSKGFEYIETADNELLSRGIWILHNRWNDPTDIKYRIEISQVLLKDFFDDIMEIFPLELLALDEEFKIRLNFNPDFTIDWHPATRAGKFYGTEIRLEGENKYSYKGKNFKFFYSQFSENRSDVRLSFVGIEDPVNFNWLNNLTQILISTQAVFLEPIK